MHPIIENILERPTSHKVGIWLCSLVLPAALFFQFSIKGIFTEVAELQDKKAQLETKLLTEQRLARNLKRVREQVKALEAKLQEAVMQLPDKKEIPSLLTSISSLAKEAGLEIQIFKPEGEILKEFYAEVPVAIQVFGSFHKVATFFDEVSRLPRIVNMAKISMRDPKLAETGEQAVTTNCVATTFRYLEESERAAMEDKKLESSKGRRRGRKKE